MKPIMFVIGLVVIGLVVASSLLHTEIEKKTTR